MMRWLLYLALALTVGVGLSNNGIALGTASDAVVQTAAQWCYSLVNGSGASGGSGSPIIAPIVECFTDTIKGIIPSVTMAFLAKVQTDYVPIVGIMMLLAIAYYGARIMIGDVQRLKASTFILGLKCAGIYLFLNNAPTIYTYMVNILQTLSFSISNAAATAHTSGFCVSTLASSPSNNSQWQAGLWGRWDCIFQYILGFSTAGFALTSIASFLWLMLFSSSAGIVVFFTGLFLILSLLVAAFRFVHVYLMSFLALSFMFCIGYLFVPLLLFRNTFDFFRKWLMLTLGFILTPVMMFGFMGMMLVALDIALFSGPYSVYCAIGGTNYCETNTASGAQLFSMIAGDTIPNGTDPNSNPNLSDSFMKFFYLALENPESMGSGSGLGGPCKSQNGGVIGWLCDMGVTGSKYDASGHYEESTVGLDFTALNLTTLASGAGSTCTLSSVGGSGGLGYSPVTYYTNCPYVEGILISICVAALLVYIMLSLLQYIPSLASSLTQDIVNQDLASFGAKTVTSQVFGENTARSVLQGGEQSALGAAQGFEKGGVGGALGGGMSSGMKFIDSMLMGDR